MTRRGLLLIGSAIIIIGAVTALIAWRLRPTAVVAGAMDRAAEAQSHSFTARLAIANAQASAASLGEQASITLEATGAYDRSQPATDALQATILASLETESVTMVTEVETRFIENAAYLLIKKMPPALSPLAQLKGQWLRLPREGAQQASSLPADESLFTNISRAGTAEINGDTVRVYSAIATPTAVLHLFDSIGALVGNRLTADQVEQFRQNVAAADGIPVRLAIAPITRELQQIESVFIAPGNQNEIHFTLTFTDRDKEVAITAPEGAKSIEELAAEQAPAAPEPQSLDEQQPEATPEPAAAQEE